MRNIELKEKYIKDIKGSFFVPSYQRGYRWTTEAIRLLEDISELIDTKDKEVKYCLQPIVVKKRSDGLFELIDGQQRLTTIFIIYKVLESLSPNMKAAFSLEYETRGQSKEFLENIDTQSCDKYIDFAYMKEVFLDVKKWFMNREIPLQTAFDFFTAFNKSVFVIWYEVGDCEDSNSLFQRLNIGKIPLTSAELVKAMFLSSDKNGLFSKERQEEMSLQWDDMEKELHNNSFWSFLTNAPLCQYQTRIDLVLDLISQKRNDELDQYYTFFYFDKLRTQQPLMDIWKGIIHCFLVMKDWFNNHSLYHKIGYLVASGSNTLRDIFFSSINKTKVEFQESLDNQIRSSVSTEENYGELSYDNPNDYKRLTRLLLLFNVESVRQNGENSQWFPFDKFKGDGKTIWSLEHIHAQESESLITEVQWKEWIYLHLPSIKSLDGDNQDLINEMEALCSPDFKLTREPFEAAQKKVIKLLSKDGNIEYMHSIGNLALLNTGDNAALNNSTFDVKRNLIVEMDKRGKFIPYCTKMVFLKYYTPSDQISIHFWGQPDREAYVKGINKVLQNYISPIILDSVKEGL